MAVQIGWRGTRLVLIVGAAFMAAASCGGGQTTRDLYPIRAMTDGPVDVGLVKKLYDMKCALCHGHDGAQQFAGAKNLTLSTMSKAEIITRIVEGKGTMPPHKDVLSEEQIDALADFVFTLH